MIVQLKIDVNRARARLQRTNAALIRSAEMTVRTTGALLLRRIKGMLSGERLRVRTGRLRSGFTFTMLSNRSGVLRSDPAIRYAAIHEYGGLILPRRTAYLRFPVEGRWVTVSQVKMPARHYVRDALQETLREVDRLSSDVVRSSIARA